MMKQRAYTAKQMVFWNLWRAACASLASFASLTACEARGPVVAGAWEKNSSCRYSIQEDWTPLCLSIEAVKVGYYRKGDRFDLKLSIRNDGVSEVENVTGYLQSFAFEEMSVEFKTIAPGEDKMVRLRLEADRDVAVTNIAFFVLTDEQCDFRARVIFPPTENPKRVGLCQRTFESLHDDRADQ